MDSNTRIVTLSSRGQITIPKIIRRNLLGRKFLLELRDEILLLKPCRISVKKKNSFASQVLVEAILKLSDNERRIYYLIRKEACSADFLCEKTALGISTINVLLTELEFKNLIRRNKDFLWVARDNNF